MIPKCFVAYSSIPVDVAETIENAIIEIKKTKHVEIESWKEMSIGGKLIISEICKKIVETDIFICDLTTLNNNVLFELGYAIAKNRRIWIILDENFNNSVEDFKKFNLISSIGFRGYHNSLKISEWFLLDRPFSDLSNTVRNQLIEPIIENERQNIFYIKSFIHNDSSIKLSHRIFRKEIDKIQIIPDDPEESRIQTLKWYSQQVNDSAAVIIHFLSSNYKKNLKHILHNAKNSLISGLAYGLGKDILMIAQEPFDSPVDYSDLLIKYTKANECESLADKFLTKFEEKVEKNRNEIKMQHKIMHSTPDLQKLLSGMGESVAEQESTQILSYFIPTAAYYKALTSDYMIFIGRKGSGKTALMYKLISDFKKMGGHHICSITPVGYDIKGIVDMLNQSLKDSEKGFLVESLWKFLIYTEIARSVFLDLKERSKFVPTNIIEDEFLNFVEINEDIILKDFSIRFENIILKLNDIEKSHTSDNQRLRISELLHSNVIPKLRMFLGELLNKKDKTIVLIDNLDKNWNQLENIPTICKLFSGLLDAGQLIVQDFLRSDSKKKPLKFSLLIFLRTDIFSKVISFTQEKDKIPHMPIVWQDKDLLLRVLEERFLSIIDSIAYNYLVWTRYFCSFHENQPTSSFLFENILPRPRFLIFLIKTALEFSINRRHYKIEENDINDALIKASQSALDTILIESNYNSEKLENFISEFICSKSIIDLNDIKSAAKNCKIQEDEMNKIIELLCDLNFFGREIERDRFEFQYNEEDKKKFLKMSIKHLADNNERNYRLKIHNAFHSFLEIKG